MQIALVSTQSSSLSRLFQDPSHSSLRILRHVDSSDLLYSLLRPRHHCSLPRLQSFLFLNLEVFSTMSSQYLHPSNQLLHFQPVLQAARATK